MNDLFNTESDDDKRDRLRAKGWVENQYATRSGTVNRYWIAPDGKALAEWQAFLWLHEEEAKEKPQ